jgi:replicative DNA helicase
MTKGKRPSPGEVSDVQVSDEAREAAELRAKERRAAQLTDLITRGTDRLDPERAMVVRAVLSEADVGDAARAAAKALDVLQAKAEASKPRPSWAETVKGAFATMGRRSQGLERPIPTPWPSVTAKIAGGWWPGLYTLASATGTGKTQWAIASAIGAARWFVKQHEEEAEERKRQGLPPPENGPERVAYVALELGDVELVARMLGIMAAEAGIKPEDVGARHPIRWSSLFFGKVPLATLVALEERFGAELAALPLHVETADAIGWSYLDLRALAERYRPRFLVLDYSQLVSPAPGKRREELRETIGNVAKVARDMARRQGLTVLALSSTARSNYGAVDGASAEPDEANGKKSKGVALGEGDAARLIGLGKESGEIEFTADVVLALARPRDQPEDGDERVMWLAIAKGRGHGTGWVKMLFDGSRYRDPEAQDRPPEEWPGAV